MAHAGTAGRIDTRPPLPVRTIDTHDISASLADAWSDFSTNRLDMIFAGLLYPAIGLAAAYAASGGALLPLLFPAIAGLSLLGPLVATGFYEIARRREDGRDAHWTHFADVLRGPARDSIVVVGAILLGLFFAWMIAGYVIYDIFMGSRLPASIGDLVHRTLTTPEGWAMMAVGNLVGLGFAILVLAVATVSLPMLVDGRGDARQAIATSLAAFRANPGMMLRWGVTVAALLVLGALPAFVGLAVVLPVLGYATWHLYTRLVDRGSRPR